MVRTPRVVIRLALALAAAGCDSTGPEPEYGVTNHYLSLHGEGTVPETGAQYGCHLRVSLHQAAPLPDSFDATGDLFVRHTAPEAHVSGYVGSLEVRFRRGDDDEVTIELAGALADTLTGTLDVAAGEPASFQGGWDCGSEVPLRNEPELTAAGVPSSFTAAGFWRLDPNVPLDEPALRTRIGVVLDEDVLDGGAVYMARDLAPIP